MNTKNNQRFKATDARIIDAYMKLIKNEDQEADKVSVSAVCRACGINRASFYLHYKDIRDLMDAVDRRLAQCYVEMFSVQSEPHMLKNPFLLLFEHVHENKKFYCAYLSRQNLFHVMEESLSIGAAGNLTNIVALRNFEEPELTYHMLYFHDGLAAIIRHWLERDCLEEPAELVEFLHHEYAPLSNTIG